jgi:hypothetical protein
MVIKVIGSHLWNWSNTYIHMTTLWNKHVRIPLGWGVFDTTVWTVVLFTFDDVSCRGLAETGTLSNILIRGLDTRRCLSLFN